MSLEFLLVKALSRGLTLRDFDEMTIGMIIDYVICYDEENNPNKKETPREATQEDIDRFFGG